MTQEGTNEEYGEVMREALADPIMMDMVIGPGIKKSAAGLQKLTVDDVHGLFCACLFELIDRGEVSKKAAAVVAGIMAGG